MLILLYICADCSCTGVTAVAAVDAAFVPAEAYFVVAHENIAVAPENTVVALAPAYIASAPENIAVTPANTAVTVHNQNNNFGLHHRRKLLPQLGMFLQRIYTASVHSCGCFAQLTTERETLLRHTRIVVVYFYY